LGQIGTSALSSIGVALDVPISHLGQTFATERCSMKAIAVALIILTVALTLAATATADDDTDFLQVLNDEGIRYGSSGDAIRQAHVVCQLFDERDSEPSRV
jgi:hypothetical protein